jgi:enamine deaminase RidA (YjgF/YER057c/UK114 family)
MPKTTLNPPGLPVPTNSYSQVAIAGQGKLVFIAGQTASDTSGDIRAQTREVLMKIKTAVEAVGGTLADIVSMSAFVTDRSFFPDVNEVRREIFEQDFPPSTMVVVSGFVRRDMLIEINATAVVS